MKTRFIYITNVSSIKFPPRGIDTFPPLLCRHDCPPRYSCENIQKRRRLRGARGVSTVPVSQALPGARGGLKHDSDRDEVRHHKTERKLNVLRNGPQR